VDYLASKDSANLDLTYFKTVEPELRLKVIQRELCSINELLFPENGLETYVNNQFLDAYLKFQDPNSSFFTNQEKDVYQNDLATQKKSFGIVTQKNRNGEIVISSLIPGSSAYKNDFLEEGNILLNLKSVHSELQINCISNADVISFLTDEKNNSVNFTVKNKTGAIKTIKLIKTEIKVTENAVRGFVINKNDLKIGYIKIPSFYTDYSSPNGRGVSSDVAKEIYKLQKEGIEGLIIDLQFNGGGSMQEAINLSGMFIDRGPLSILKFNNGETFTIKDPKRGSFFNKPMVIIQNDFSASASEFFTAAMQDYKRAIIVGGNSFGKSSAQNIMPLKENSNIGFCKITVELFYRVTGQTHQAKGIVPDIVLPTLFNKLQNTEADKKHVILDSTITPTLNYFKKNLKSLETITSKSNIRVSKNDFFIKMDADSQLLFDVVNHTKETPYKLNILDIKNRRTKISENYDTIFSQNQSKLLEISNTSATNELISYNNEEKEENELIIDDLSKDIYINESYNILTDYINLN
jgi:carboxyl-terminal processing protease